MADDGLPNPPGAVTTTWSKVSGPGTVTFNEASAADTTATFSEDGTYVLRLTGNDGALSASDIVTITVGGPPTNQEPQVEAGPDQNIANGQTATLSGTVTDDGLPNPPGAVTSTWSKVSGPGTVTFGNASAVDTTATFSANGTYVLRLTANDGALTQSDTVTVTVSSGPSPGQNDLVFLHHSVGENWLASGLQTALVAKSYVDEYNDITYGTALGADSGRPASLGGVPGDSTDMNHWVLWFNDYLLGARGFGCDNGYNQIIMFKSCFPNSHIADDGTEPGDPFGDATLANYKAVYRHPSGAGHTYQHDGNTYRPLGDIFPAHPDILFIAVTAPPLCYAPNDETDNAAAHRARLFNNWLKGEWLTSYKAAHPGLNNVAVFDLFNYLAYPDNHASHPNRLRQEYGGAAGDSHPNSAANQYLTRVFATDPGNFLDAAWAAFPK